MQEVPIFFQMNGSPAKPNLFLIECSRSNFANNTTGQYGNLKREKYLYNRKMVEGLITQLRTNEKKIRVAGVTITLDNVTKARMLEYVETVLQSHDDDWGIK